ncbi:MAG: class I SAM-dependent rRNA methyltransferase [Chloroflexi bacterium]|nr:class I SAM-dependent rRNA methyltransferase [Chloroflexota bacterium]
MARQEAKLAYVRADARLSAVLAQGHPWVYGDAIAQAPPGLPTGAWVRVQCGKHQYYGLWDAESPIAVRIFSRKQRPNQAWVQARVREAWTLRSPLRQPQAHTSAYRWIYGAADGLPGVIVDLYGAEANDQQWAVVRLYSASVQHLQSWLTSALTSTTALTGIIARSHTPGEYTLWHGTAPAQPIIIRENDLRFEVDIIQGQKTGFFLDQRQNRQTIGQTSQGLRVLNLFSYTGGFSLYAARGGARQVVSVDSARPAMAAARRNFQLNGIDPAQHDFIVGDCFAVLADFYQAGRRFDLIIVDPPSFARSKAQLDAALHAYHRINTLAMQCLAPDGLLASSSCSSQLGPEAFKGMLAVAATAAGRRLRILHEAGHALDHPVLPSFPEGRYLKFVLARTLAVF